MKPISFAARTLQFCELREARLVLKREMREDRCTEAEEGDLASGGGDPGSPRCYQQIGNDGDRLAAEERCEACQRNAARYTEVGRLSAKIGGTLNAMMSAWRREYQ